MNKKIMIIILIVALLTVGGGAFYGGMFYAKSQKSRTGFPLGANGDFQGNRLNKNGAGGANIVSGYIIGKDDKSITINMTDNSGSKIIFYSTATRVTVNGTAADLVAGDLALVNGTINPDGSITAQSIQMKPSSQVIPY